MAGSKRTNVKKNPKKEREMKQRVHRKRGPLGETLEAFSKFWYGGPGRYTLGALSGVVFLTRPEHYRFFNHLMGAEWQKLINEANHYPGDLWAIALHAGVGMFAVYKFRNKQSAKDTMKQISNGWKHTVHAGKAVGAATGTLYVKLMNQKTGKPEVTRFDERGVTTIHEGEVPDRANEDLIDDRDSFDGDLFDDFPKEK